MREEAPEQPSAAEQIRACADTLEFGPRFGFKHFRVQGFNICGIGL